MSVGVLCAHGHLAVRLMRAEGWIEGTQPEEEKGKAFGMLSADRDPYRGPSDVVAQRCEVHADGNRPF